MGCHSSATNKLSIFSIPSSANSMGRPPGIACKLQNWSLLVLIMAMASFSKPATSSLPLEIEALLHFKEQIQQDPSQSLASWTSSSTSPCLWPGIKCTATAAPRVESISLPNRNLVGTLSFSSWITPLSALHTIDLSGNHFNGNLSTILSGTCTQLQMLNLAGNYFTGGLPATLLSGCGGIHSLNLSNNAISGDIPSIFLSSCNELATLDLSGNEITGSLTPVGTSFCPSLLHLHLARNLIDGTLPPTLLSNSSPTLLSLDLSSNKISGSVPDNFFAKCDALLFVDLSSNNFSGPLPTSLQTFLVHHLLCDCSINS